MKQGKKNIQYTHMEKIGGWGNWIEFNININISLTKIHYIDIAHKSYLSNLTRKENKLKKK